MLKAVIFDFDGVLADSELLHYKALNRAFGRYGVSVPKEQHWQKYLGYSDIENIQAVSRDYRMGLNKEQVQEVFELKTQYFEELIAGEPAIIDGVVDFVNRLSLAGLSLAVCSGATARDIETILAGSALRDMFEVIVTADDVSRGKPDPEGYLLTLALLNSGSGTEILPGECVVVEDSRWGLEAARQAGMHRVAVANTYPAAELEAYAEKIVGRIEELKIEDIRQLCRK